MILCRQCTANWGRVAPGSGAWMPCLLENLRRAPGTQVDVVTVYPGLRDDQFNEDGVEYFVIGQPRFHPLFGCRKKDLERSVSLIRERVPDLIHIDGTERFYSLIAARKLTPTPCVISLQGLLGPYLDGFFCALSPLELWRSERFIEVATRRGLLW
jgi:hypothetical protein